MYEIKDSKNKGSSKKFEEEWKQMRMYEIKDSQNKSNSKKCEGEMWKQMSIHNEWQ